MSECSSVEWARENGESVEWAHAMWSCECKEDDK